MQEWRADIVLDEHTGLGEGPIWWSEEQCLLWVDIEASRIGLYQPEKKSNRWINIGRHVGCVTPMQSGKLLLACRDGFHRLDIDTEKLDLIDDPERTIRGNRFNDGKCDPWGRFLAGSMSYQFTEGAGTLWCLDSSLKAYPILKHLGISNGLAWNLERSCFYFIDSITRKVEVFELDSKGSIVKSLGACIEIPKEWESLPDGMTIDDEGMLWIALFAGGSVMRWDPSNGELIGKVDVPCKQVTSCAFGGRKLNQLFITTARRELSVEECRNQPFAGGLFVADVGTTGPAATLFNQL
ncbi:MAG: SMP-30/gluconolactonase/LRE family protein [Prochlorococcus sp.]